MQNKADNTTAFFGGQAQTQSDRKTFAICTFCSCYSAQVPPYLYLF